METTEIQASKIDEFVKEKRHLAGEIDGVQNQIIDLTRRHDELIKAIPVLKIDLEDAAIRRKTAFDEFILEQISKDELDLSGKRVDLARRELSEALEMIEALERTKAKLTAELTPLQNRAQGVDHELWSGVVAEIKKDLEALVGDKIGKAWAASRKSGVQLDYVFFLQKIFGGPPALDRVTELSQQLEEAYL